MSKKIQVVKARREPVMNKPGTVTPSMVEQAIKHEDLAKQNGENIISALKTDQFDKADNLAHLSIDTTVTDEDDNTLLHLSILKHRWTLVGNILIADSGSLTSFNKDGKTPLDLIKEVEKTLQAAVKGKTASKSDLEFCQSTRETLEKLTTAVLALPPTSVRKLSDSGSFLDSSDKEGKHKDHTKSKDSRSGSTDSTSSSKALTPPKSSPLSPILTERSFLNEPDFGITKLPSKSSPSSKVATPKLRIDAGDSLSTPESVVIHTPTPSKTPTSGTGGHKKTYSWSIASSDPDYVYDSIEEEPSTVVTGDGSASEQAS